MIVATLAHPSGLRSSLLDEAAAALGAAGWTWLDESQAADIEADLPLAEARARLAPFEAQADVIVQAAAERSRRLLVADMDSTMITVECLDELADYAGVKAQVAEITARAMRGELDFAGALKARVALLTGLDSYMIARCLEERVRMAPGAVTLIATLRAEAIRTVLVTGGFTDFAEPVAGDLGFDSVHANRIEIRDGQLTGRVLDPIIGGEGKRMALMREAQALGISPAAVLAIGDGANDVPMFQTAGLGVAVHGKPAAEAAADARIRHGDLTTLLWSLGLPRARWVNRA